MTETKLVKLITVLDFCVGVFFIYCVPAMVLEIASMVKRCTSAHKPCMVVGWVWLDGCGLVGKWFAGCVGWCVG